MRLSRVPVTGVVVQAGHNTQIKTGTLAISKVAREPVDLLIADGKTRLDGWYDRSVQAGLPVGTYTVRTAGRTQQVTISGGQVTER